MVSSPSYHRSQNDSLISKRTIRVITCCIAEQMSVSRRIGKIVFTIIFMHPRSFEETAFCIPCCQWLTVFIQNYHCPGFFGKLHHVFTQTSNTRRDCLLLSFRQNGRFQGFIITVTLKLSTPQSTEIHIIVTISVIPYSRIDAVTSLHRISFRYKRTIRFITHSYPDTKYIILIFQWKIHIILTIFTNHITIPKLTARPRNILRGKHHSMIFYFTVHHIIHRIHVIIFHIEMIAIIIFGNTTFPIVRGINIQFAIKYMYGRVSHIITGN